VPDEWQQGLGCGAFVVSGVLMNGEDHPREAEYQLGLAAALEALVQLFCISGSQVLAGGRVGGCTATEGEDLGKEFVGVQTSRKGCPVFQQELVEIGVNLAGRKGVLGFHFIIVSYCISGWKLEGSSVPLSSLVPGFLGIYLCIGIRTRTASRVAV